MFLLHWAPQNMQAFLLAHHLATTRYLLTDLGCPLQSFSDLHSSLYYLLTLDFLFVLYLGKAVLYVGAV